MFNTILHHLLDRCGIEAVRSSTMHRFLRTRHFDLLVDVGANLGQFAQSMRAKGYRGRIHSFEPTSGVFPALAARAARDGRWQTSKLALGAAPGEVEMMTYANHTLNSIHAINEAGAGHLAVDTAVTGRETVPLATLDAVLADDPATSILLKIDTQGHERQVLDGAGETLRRTHAVLLELPIEHLYRDVWSFTEALTYLDRRGFVPAQFRTVNTMADDSASAMEFDCLFRRKTDA